MYKRHVFNELLNRINEKRKFIQVLVGPRQTGKTTISKQIVDEIDLPNHYAAADEPALKNTTWIEQQWETARAKAKTSNKKTLLVLDEIQKITNWSETVKKLWDEDTANKTNLPVIILGSSQLLMQKGLTESLSGRFEVLHVTHWAFNEMKAAFGWDIDKFIFFGGYPGSALLVEDETRWKNYILDSLIETTISKDILLMTRIDKPALIKRLFELGCAYSGQILSYQKMLGQLQDTGNTTTLAHYLDLLEKAGLLTGLQKYSGQHIRQRGSSPKFQVLNNALLSVHLDLTFKEAFKNKELWGRLLESAVGSYLVNNVKGKNIKLFYWLGNNREVDFVLNKGKSLVAIEVKSGNRKTNLPGIDLFSKKFKTVKNLLIGEQGIKTEEFVSIPVETWFE
ncbi:MAG: AAA family ATPase [Elusimicrobia bacterium RIFOXYA2_FULL_39_19]|nr:MAG: AAA family ATPase [Elusimicrobia bacterium RIFOXYA2_FULL_39_19]